MEFNFRSKECRHPGRRATRSDNGRSSSTISRRFLPSSARAIPSTSPILRGETRNIPTTRRGAALLDEAGVRRQRRHALSLKLLPPLGAGHSLWSTFIQQSLGGSAFPSRSSATMAAASSSMSMKSTPSTAKPAAQYPTIPPSRHGLVSSGSRRATLDNKGAGRQDVDKNIDDAATEVEPGSAALTQFVRK